jgi:dolichol-phosphate mannosyltransferase
MRVVMIPCRNEADSIGGLVRRALEHCDRVFVANDNSTDATAEVAASAGATVLTVPAQRRGLVGTYTFGLRSALTVVGREDTYIAEMDAGGSHDPAALPRFWSTLDYGFGIATGCRFGLRGAKYEGHWKRKALSWGGAQLTNLLHGTGFYDATSGFIAYRGDALAMLLEAGAFASSGHYYQTELRLRARELGIFMQEVPIVYKNSGSSLNWKSVAEALRLVVP